MRSTDVVLASRHTGLAVVAGAEVPYPACEQTSAREDQSISSAFEVQWKRMISKMAGGQTNVYLVQDGTQVGICD